MSDEVSWHVELAVKPGQLDAFRALTGDMVAFTRTEAGVKSYQRFVSDDGKVVHIYERYENSAAALAHLKNFAARFGSRFGTMVDRRSFAVFGHPSRELRQVLGGLGAVHFAPFGDFEYWS